MVKRQGRLSGVPADILIHALNLVVHDTLNRAISWESTLAQVRELIENGPQREQVIAVLDRARVGARFQSNIHYLIRPFRGVSEQPCEMGEMLEAALARVGREEDLIRPLSLKEVPKDCLAAVDTGHAHRLFVCLAAHVALSSGTEGASVTLRSQPCDTITVSFVFTELVDNAKRREALLHKAFEDAFSEALWDRSLLDLVTAREMLRNLGGRLIVSARKSNFMGSVETDLSAVLPRAST